MDGCVEGHRTLVVSLGSFCSAIELHPHFGDLAIGKVRAEGTCLCRHRRRRSMGSYRSTATGGLSILNEDRKKAPMASGSAKSPGELSGLKIGRASCRERGWKYVMIWAGAGS